jgi:cysteine sulfinate desulfinase/cysteine desulfurase-like protein
MGLPSHRTQNSIRISLGARNTDAEIDAFLDTLPKVVAKLRLVTGARR